MYSNSFFQEINLRFFFFRKLNHFFQNWWPFRRLCKETAYSDAILSTFDQILSSKSSREDMCRLPTSFLLNIKSHVKQEVDMLQIQNCVTRYSSPYWCSVPNIRKLTCVVPEKNVTAIFCDADDDDDDARRQKWSLYVASAKAGRRHNNYDRIYS